ncbi:MAG: spore maturation protein, partial [Ferruginibacter sp.]
MALSRIWCAFIIIAVLVAGAKFFFQPGQEKLITNLFTGKNTDTVSARTLDSAAVPVLLQSQLQNQKTAVWGKEKVFKNTSGNYTAYT